MNKRDDPRIKKIGEHIARLRKTAGFSSAEKFAYEHNISRAQYGNYEKGADMRLSSLLRVLDAHGITLAEFCKGLQ